MIEAVIIKVTEEKRELDEKLNSLIVFLGSTPNVVEPAHLSLMEKQRDAMFDYSEILGERLKDMNNKSR